MVGIVSKRRIQNWSRIEDWSGNDQDMMEFFIMGMCDDIRACVVEDMDPRSGSIPDYLSGAKLVYT